MSRCSQCGSKDCCGGALEDQITRLRHRLSDEQEKTIELEQQLAEAKRENLRQRVEDIRNNWFYENEFNDSLMEAFYLDVKPKFNPFNQEHTDKIIADWLITQGVEGVKE